MDATSVSVSVLPSNFFFFEQTSYRKTPKRYKKLPEELPKDIRYALLTPRVASYLASKDKDALKIGEKEGEFAGNNKSLLPQINAKVTHLQNQLNSAFTNDEGSQRYLFEKAKLTAEAVIKQLIRILYIFEGLRISLPKTLESQLLCGYKDLTINVNYVPREWQLSSNREEHLRKLNLMPTKDEIQKSNGDNDTDTGSLSNISRQTGEDDTKSVKSSSEKEKISKSPKKGAGMRGQVLQDIAEVNVEEKDGGGKGEVQNAPHPPLPTAVASNVKKESHKDKDPALPRPRTRLERFKSSMAMTPSLSDSRTSAGHSQRSATANRQRTDDLHSIMAESNSDNMLLDRNAGLTIHFQLSSKQCEEKGWIIHPDVTADKERETILEWATQRLQLAIKQRKDQESADKERGCDKPIVLRYYGENKRDVMNRYHRNIIPTHHAKVSSHLLKGQKPDVPALPDEKDKRKVLLTTVSDGSTTIYYPSGLPAIVTSMCPVRKTSYYTVVYDDCPEKKMMGVFTPAGKGCCYHGNGVVRFLCTEREWTLSDDEGSVTRRAKWPSNGLKMPAGVTVPLNPFLTLRCSSHTTMHLYFSAVKETAKLYVGACGDIDDDKDEPVQLLSGLPFTSQTAKEFMKPQKSKSNTNSKAKLSKTTKGKNKQPPEIQKLLEMPEPTENDAEADKNLYKLQRKIKNLVEDWLEHYRLNLGLSSPHLRTLPSAPLGRIIREASSAKSSPPGVRVILESLTTQVPKHHISSRVPSAPAGRIQDQFCPSSSSRERPASSGIAVKFSEASLEEEETGTEDMSVVRTTPMVSTAPSLSSHRSNRAKSAPQRRMALTMDTVWSLRFGSCPVALRQMMVGEERATCKCSKHNVPHVTDIEYDEYIQKHVPVRQMLIIAVISSVYPEAMPAREMLDQLYGDRNRNRTQPCIQARGDAYRILLYDCSTAANYTDHSQPLLLRRHNVVPGMFLMYDNGKLVFCDHIFNGYGNEKKDFHKQIMLTRRLANMGRHLPQDFKFSPQKGRTGPRAAWGGEIGGTGIDHYGNAGLVPEKYRGSFTSLTSTDSRDVPLDYHLAGLDVAAQFINLRVTSSGFTIDQNHEPRTNALLSTQYPEIIKV